MTFYAVVRIRDQQVISSGPSLAKVALALDPGTVWGADEDSIEAAEDCAMAKAQKYADSGYEEWVLH